MHKSCAIFGPTSNCNPSTVDLICSSSKLFKMVNYFSTIMSFVLESLPESELNRAWPTTMVDLYNTGSSSELFATTSWSMGLIELQRGSRRDSGVGGNCLWSSASYTLSRYLDEALEGNLTRPLVPPPPPPPLAPPRMHYRWCANPHLPHIGQYTPYLG